MSQYRIERVDATTVRINANVVAFDVDAAFERAFSEVERLKKRPLGKRQLGDDPRTTAENAVAARATRDIAETAIRKAIEAENLRLTQNPTVDIDTMASRGRSFTFSFDVQVVPECTLGDYSCLVVRLPRASEVTDKDVLEKLEEIRKRSADLKRHSPEPLSGMDIAKITFSSTIDGEGYEGDSAQGYAYQLGSLHLPQGFEDGLAGMKTGDRKTISFAIPDDFDNRQIAGKLARFDVQVEDATKVTLPEIDDSFAQGFGYADLAEFKDVLRRRIIEEREGEREAEREREARRALADLLVEEVPDSLVDAQSRRMLVAFKSELLQQNIQFSDYCSFLGLSEDLVVDEMKEEALRTLRENLALESLFRDRGMVVTQGELDNTTREVSMDNGLAFDQPYEALAVEQQQAIREMTVHRLATEWLLKHAEFVEG